MKISNEQIIKAGSDLLAANKLVTPFGIRNILGSGCPKRIKKVWDAHTADEALDGVLIEITETPALPAEFQETLEAMKEDLARLASGLYSRAFEVSESRVRDTIKEAKRIKQEATQSTREAMEAVSGLDQQLEGLQISLNDSQGEVKTLSSDNMRLAERVKLLEEGLKEHKKVLSEQKSNSKKYETEAIKLSTLNSSLQDESQLLKDEVSELINTLDEHKSFKAKCATLASDNVKLESEIVKHEKAFKKTDDLREKHALDSAGLLSQVNEKSIENTKLTKDLDASNKATDSAQKRANVLQGELNVLKKQFVSLENNPRPHSGKK